MNEVVLTTDEWLAFHTATFATVLSGFEFIGVIMIFVFVLKPPDFEYKGRDPHVTADLSLSVRVYYWQLSTHP